jgi:DNA-binding NarL/FixJ family response regulator
MVNSLRDETMSRPIRVLILELTLNRLGIKAFLRQTKGIVVCGQGSSVKNALSLAKKSKPHVALIGIHLSDGSGFEAAKQIHRHLPETRIAVLGDGPDGEAFLASLIAGTSGFLPKGADADTFIQCVQTLAKGGAYLYPSSLYLEIADHFTGTSDRLKELATNLKNINLTKREKEVVTKVAEGKGNDRIAKEMNITIQSVKNYLSRIYGKVGVRTRTQLLAILGTLFWPAGDKNDY